MPMWPIIPMLVLLGTMLTSCSSDSEEESEEDASEEEKSTIEKICDAVKQCENDKGQYCTCNALVCCTSSENEGETVLIKKEIRGSNVLIADIAQLNRSDIEREKPFTGCKLSSDKKCTVEKKYIENQTWQDYDENNSQGEGKEWLSEDKSYMMCTYGTGYIFFKSAGQALRSQMEELAEKDRMLEEYNWYYEKNKEWISKIDSINADGRFDYDIWNFRKIYEANKDIYESLSQQTGVPPQLIAALHYRESGCNFNTYLHNGQPLGQPTTIDPKDRIFDDFLEAALDALTSELNNKHIVLTENDSIVMMATFAEIYNGTGYTQYKEIASPYVYSGTNVYISGKYISDKKYDENAVDKQPGIYLLIKSLEE